MNLNELIEISESLASLSKILGVSESDILFAMRRNDVISEEQFIEIMESRL